MEPRTLPALGYFSFILRCWRETTEPGEEAAVWRFSLAPVANPRSPSGFATIEDMVAYLRTHLAGQPIEDEPIPPSCA